MSSLIIWSRVDMKWPAHFGWKKNGFWKNWINWVHSLPKHQSCKIRENLTEMRLYQSYFKGRLIVLRPLFDHRVFWVIFYSSIKWIALFVCAVGLFQAVMKYSHAACERKHKRGKIFCVCVCVHNIQYVHAACIWWIENILQYVWDTWLVNTQYRWVAFRQNEPK